MKINDLYLIKVLIKFENLVFWWAFDEYITKWYTIKYSVSSSIHQTFPKTQPLNFTAMNCTQFNKISVEEVLQSLGHFPTKQNEKEAWFINPFSKENNASFKINRKLNYWYLFSEGIGGNNIDLMKKYLNASISEVLK